MVGTIGRLWRTSSRLSELRGDSTVGLFTLAMLFWAAPANAQRAAPSQDPPAPLSYKTTWSRGGWSPPYSPGTWQVSPAAHGLSSTTGTVPNPNPVPTEPVAPVPSGILRISAREKPSDTESDDRPTLFGNPELFRLESEQRLRERAQAEAKTAGKRPLPFPTEPTLSPVRRPGPNAVATVAVVEPSYLCYDRLMFEEKNSERYGWDLGPIGVLVSPADFYFKVFTAPIARLADPCRSFETNAGYCLPGDPVPYRLQLPCSGSSR